MNKKDLVFIVLILLFAMSLYFLNLNVTIGNVAYVYYESELIKELDLTVDFYYIVSGYNGEVGIEVYSGQVRIVSETSPYNICSKQGFISKSNESLVCLPNKIVIKIPGNSLDVEVG